MFWCVYVPFLSFLIPNSYQINLIHTAALVGQKSEVNANCIQASNHLLLRPYVVGVMAKGHPRL